MLFLQETDSRERIETSWNKDFKKMLFFLHGTPNSSRVAIGNSGEKTYLLESPFFLDITIYEQSFFNLILPEGSTIIPPHIKNLITVIVLEKLMVLTWIFMTFAIILLPLGAWQRKISRILLISALLLDAPISARKNSWT